MNATFDEILGNTEMLYIPVVYGTGESVDGSSRNGTFFGIPCGTQQAAWAAAREMCEQMDGMGFCVRRVDPTTGGCHGD